jgi:hypothetical protein
MATPAYVPILKGKEGEFAALETLRDNVPAQIMPVIEMPTVPYDYANERPSRTIEEHIVNVTERLRRCWDTRPVYIDVPWSNDNEGGPAPLDVALRRCEAGGIQAVPVISRRSAAEAIRAAARYAQATRTGPCVRLFVDDFEDDVDIEADTRQLLAPFGDAMCDLILDLGDISNSSSPAQLIARSMFSMMPTRGRWRRVILAAASFPVDLSDVDAATTTTIPRREWQLWQALQRRQTGLPQQGIIYSDYAISHPLPRELDPRIMIMSASIRYTTDSAWLVVKGRNVRQYGFEQYFELCRALVERPEYYGGTFSWGDEYIARCAAREIGPGNATTWRKVGTNHHITVVVRAIANLERAA